MAVAGYPLTLAHEFYGGWDGVLGILLGASVLATYLHTHSAAACNVWLFSERLPVVIQGEIDHDEGTLAYKYKQYPTPGAINFMTYLQESELRLIPGASFSVQSL